jgi:hypothetical protein
MSSDVMSDLSGSPAADWSEWIFAAPQRRQNAQAEVSYTFGCVELGNRSACTFCQMTESCSEPTLQL